VAGAWPFTNFKEKKMSTVLEVAENIERIINALKAEGVKSQDLVTAKAVCISDYDKAIGVATLTLKSEGHPATLIPSLAKNVASDQRRDMVVAEEMLKAHYSRIGILEAQLNGYQSIFRHLQSMG
jgi:hypothetical protein